MMNKPLNLIALSRSLLIYYGQFWKVLRLKKFYSGFIKPDDLCFDLGAHVGHRSLVLSQIGARVVACEPQPFLNSWLERLQKISHFTLVKKALSNEVGVVRLHQTRSNFMINSLDPNWTDRLNKVDKVKNKWIHFTDVSATTLSSLISEYGTPKYCKIDCEGFDHIILSDLKTPISYVSFEYLPQNHDLAMKSLNEIERLNTKNHKYLFNFVKGENQKFSLSQWVDRAELEETLLQFKNKRLCLDVYAHLAPCS